MNKKGIALAVVLVVVAVLSVIIISLFSKAIHEKNLVARHVNTLRAFWLAEAGISESFVNLMPASNDIGEAQGCPPGANCSYWTEVEKISDLGSGDDYYRIDSTGEVILAEGSQIRNNLAVIVRTVPPGAGNFPHAIETTGELIIKGQAYEIDGTVNEEADLNFSDLFAATKKEMKDNATYLYDETDNFAGDGVEVSGLTWVEVSSGEELTISGNFEGEGILIVSGDCHITGTESFDGIIYVIGELTMSGNATVGGSILAESATDIDTTITGNITVNHDPDLIDTALAVLPDALDRPVYLAKEISVWQQK